MSALPIHRLPAGIEPPDETLFEQIADQLQERGYAILPCALPEVIAVGALTHLQQLQDEAFQKAGIGRGDEQLQNSFVRRDQIHWLDESDARAATWLDWTHSLQTFLNRRLFLGLFSFESHFAHYQPGDFYKTHLDAFRGQSNRVLSLVTYLNRSWEPDQGGELVIYSEQGDKLAKVSPTFGSLVIFLSEEFPHEVLPTARDRYSIAGWFRVNNSINGQIDPPR